LGIGAQTRQLGWLGARSQQWKQQRWRLAEIFADARAPIFSTNP
jgi:hypothetical protein